MEVTYGKMGAGRVFVLFEDDQTYKRVEFSLDGSWETCPRKNGWASMQGTFSPILDPPMPEVDRMRLSIVRVMCTLMGCDSFRVVDCRLFQMALSKISDERNAEWRRQERKRRRRERKRA